MTTAIMKSNPEVYLQLKKIKPKYGSNQSGVISYMEEHNLPVELPSARAYIIDISKKYVDGEYAARTVNTKLSALSYLFNEYVSRLHVPEADKMVFTAQLAKLRKEHALKSDESVDPEIVPTLQEYRKFLATAPDTAPKYFVQFAAFTGARISEMIGLRLSDIKENTRNVRCTVRGKGGRERVLRIKKEFYEELLEFFKGTTFLFEHNGRGYNRTSISSRVKYITLKYMGKECSIHIFRHFYATRAVKKGKPLDAIARELGHSPGMTLRLYAHNVMEWQDLLDLEVE